MTLMLKIFSNNNVYRKEIFFLFFLYITLLISFLIGENSTGGALKDYINQKSISIKFSSDFFETLYTYDKFSTRHSPILIIFLSFFEKIFLSDILIRLIHLHLCLFLPLIFFNCLKIKFKDIDKKILILLTSLIFLSPTFRSLAIWPDSRLFGLIFFSISIFYFLKFNENKRFIFAINNIFFVALSSYLSPNFAVFSIFFMMKFIFYYNFFSHKIFLLIILNLFLAFPAFYYIFILEINFFLKSAAIGIKTNESIIFNNLFNDVLITFSLIFFYLIPFIFTKVIKLNEFFTIKNFFISIVIFLSCVFYFDYNYLYSGGGIFLKFSNYFFNNNYLFYIISFLAILLILPMILKNYFNLLLFVLIILSNPQYTIYHKYFDPFLLIAFFTIFNLDIDLDKISKNKSYLYIFSYFVIFLIISNLKHIWTI